MMIFRSNKIKYALIFKNELREWFKFLMQLIPGVTGIRLRGAYWRRKFAQCEKLTILQGCTITSPKNISIGRSFTLMQNSCLFAHSKGRILIGDRVLLNRNVVLGASDNGEIVIGNDVLIGFNAVIRASNHQYKRKDIPIAKQGYVGGKVVIENDVWIGANVVILSNVKIGQGAVIGAGAVVNKDVPPYSLAAGVPAKIIKEKIRT